MLSHSGTAGGLTAVRAASLLVATGLLLVQPGCQSDDVELLEVTGAVTLDGQPLPNASVRFLPIVEGSEPARPSSAVTDLAGAYRLGYSTTRSGARSGKYRVLISTFRPGELQIDGKVSPATRELVPSVYNVETSLVAEISPSQRAFDFDLKSDAGKIVQPRR